MTKPGVQNSAAEVQSQPRVSNPHRDLVSTSMVFPHQLSSQKASVLTDIQYAWSRLDTAMGIQEIKFSLEKRVEA